MLDQLTGKLESPPLPLIKTVTPFQEKIVPSFRKLWHSAFLPDFVSIAER
jgi:hypothetical protein